MLMTRRSWKICMVLMVIGLLSGLIHLRYAAGFLIGAIVGVVLYLRNDRFWNGVVDIGNAGKGTGIFHFLINYSLMAGVMILAVRIPSYFNIFTCAAGMMIIKFTVIAESLLPRKESEQ